MDLGFLVGVQLKTIKHALKSTLAGRFDAAATPSLVSVKRKRTGREPEQKYYYRCYSYLPLAFLGDVHYLPHRVFVGIVYRIQHLGIGYGLVKLFTLIEQHFFCRIIVRKRTQLLLIGSNLISGNNESQNCERRDGCHHRRCERAGGSPHSSYCPRIRGIRLPLSQSGHYSSMKERRWLKHFDTSLFEQQGCDLGCLECSQAIRAMIVMSSNRGSIVFAQTRERRTLY
jgi:hypothetical protein